MTRTELSDELLDAFRQSLVECRRIYLEAAQRMVTHYPQLIAQQQQTFVAQMDDLHKGLLIKVYVTVSEADQRWTGGERRLAQELFLHTWGRWIEGPQLRETAREIFAYAAKLRWFALLRPFARFRQLQDSIGPLETIFLRVANLVAKAEGDPGAPELRRLRMLQDEFNVHLRRLGLEDAELGSGKSSQESTPRRELPANAAADTARQDRRTGPAAREGAEVIQTIERELAQRPRSLRQPVVTAEVVECKSATVDDALHQLEALIGLDSIKREVRSLTNYLKLQQQRQAAGLPPAQLSLHTVFTGNPGTGKTTVARLLGQIFHALGILEKGHLVETDRSGLVAEFAGQTGPKVNRKIDEALGGVLFIDEAYSLIAESRDDPYGAEAVQALLKRSEDDRHRLVVVLAGYPEPMRNLLTSNPGLSSRFSRIFEFDDYQPAELVQIFTSLCEQNHYELPLATQKRLLAGLTWHFEQRDEHFGNGRLVRNLFEAAVRALADRVVEIVPLTKDLLTRLEPDDLRFEQVPAEWLR